MLGIHDYDQTLGDVSADSFRYQAKMYRQFTLELASLVDPSVLDERQVLDYELCMALSERNSIYAEHDRQWERDPSFYVFLGVWGCMILFLKDFAPLEERLENMLGRMKEIPDLISQAISNISDPPEVYVTIAIESVDGGLHFFKEIVPELAKQFPSLRGELLDANQAAIESFERYRTWLNDELLPTAEASFALGCKGYRQLLFAEHRLTYNPQDLVTFAQSAIAETENEIHELAARIDPDLHWKNLIAKLKSQHPPKDRLLDAYTTAVQSARQFVEERDLVTIPDNAPLMASWTPEIERTTLPYAAYFPPAPFGKSKAGTLWVTPIDEEAPKVHQMAQLRGHCIHSIPIIALHEGFPGHHLQLATQIEKGSSLAKQLNSSLLMEGWALYCEQMMYEQGFYTDPRVRLFQLKDVLWRAARVIIDVGLHTESMSFDEAVDMLVDKACFERVNAVAEVKRYTQMPTQPMTYLIGKMLVLDLKQRMKIQMGSNFDLKKFHDKLLSYGSIPPPLIAKSMLGTPQETEQPLRKTA